MAGSKPHYTEPWFREEICRLYLSGLSAKQVARDLGVGDPFVRKVLRANSIQIRVKWWQKKCVDCGEETTGALRCPYHIKLRVTFTNRMAQRRYKQIPPERWIWKDPVQ